AVNNDRMNGTVAQQLEQRGHVGLELLRVRYAAVCDAVPQCATAAEQEAKRGPQLEPRQTESCRTQAFAPDCHRLRPIADQQPAGGEAGERLFEVGATDRIEGGIDASAAPAARAKPVHERNEVAGAIVD